MLLGYVFLITNDIYDLIINFFLKFMYIYKLEIMNDSHRRSVGNLNGSLTCHSGRCAKNSNTPEAILAAAS